MMKGRGQDFIRQGTHLAFWRGQMPLGTSGTVVQAGLREQPWGGGEEATHPGGRRVPAIMHYKVP